MRRALLLLLCGVVTASALPETVEFQRGTTKWGSYGSGDGQFWAPHGVAADGLGHVYVADRDNNRIQKFDSNGNFLAKWGSIGGTDGQFRLPTGLASDGLGHVYVADGQNDRIQKFDSSGNFLAKWGNEGGGDGQLYGPRGVAADGLGHVYVADTFNNRIQKFDSNGNFLAKWGNLGSGDGQFFEPKGVAADGLGHVYVADAGNHRIQKFDSSGNFLAKWGGQGSGDGQFRDPWGVAADGLGHVYVADSGNDRIQKFDSSGNFLAKWGGWGSGDGQFREPRGVAPDGLGHVYVADTWNDRIQKFFLPPAVQPPTLTILDQSLKPGNSYVSDRHCNLCDPPQIIERAIAENFIVDTRQFFLDAAELYGYYAPDNVPNQDDDFDVRIYRDVAGLPGPLVHGAASVPSSRLFSDTEPYWLFRLEIFPPAMLSTGRYWIEITNDTRFNPGQDFAWGTGYLSGLEEGLDGYAIANEVPGNNWYAASPPGWSNLSLRLDGSVPDPVPFQNAALRFDGVDDVVTIPDLNYNFDFGTAMTIEAWVNIRSDRVGESQHFVVGYGSLADSWWLGTGPLTNCAFSVRTASQVGTTLQTQAEGCLSSGWHHVAGTYDGVTMVLYRDGVPLASRAHSSPGPVMDVSHIELGALFGEYSRGILDEVAIWNVARTRQEIKSDARGLSGDEAGLVGYWKFDEGTGQVAGDSTPWSNDGHLGGDLQLAPDDPVWIESDGPIFTDGFESGDVSAWSSSTP